MKKGYLWNILVKVWPLIPYILYGIVVWLVFLPVINAHPDQLIFGDDIHRSYGFFRQLFQTAIRSGEFPWWNPYLNSGEPFIANPSVSFWYPPNWLFAVMPYPRAYAVIIPFHIFLAMAGMYWLIIKAQGVGLRVLGVGFREQIGKVVPAWVGGLVFGFSGYLMARVWAGHADIITSAPYLPVVFGHIYLLVLERKREMIPRRIVWSGIFIALQIYAGYQTISFYTMEAVAILILVSVIRNRTLAPVFRTAGAFVVGLGLSALQLIPAQEFFRRSIRTFPLAYEWAVTGALHRFQLNQLFDPFIYGDQHAYQGPFPGYPESAAYVGKIPLILALTVSIIIIIRLLKMLFNLKKRRTHENDLSIVFSMVLILIFSIWVSMAYFAPFDLQYFLWKTVPFYRVMRIPPRHLILFVFSAATLFAYGMRVMRNKFLIVILSTLVVFDLLPFARHFVETSAIPEKRHDPSLVELFQQGGTNRVLFNFGVASTPRDSLDFDAVMPYRIFSTTGYDPSILRSYYELISAINGTVKNIDISQNDVQVPPLEVNTYYTDTLNIRYLFVPSWVSIDDKKRFPQIMENKNRGYQVFENISVLPRFYFVPTVTVLAARQDVAHAIGRKEINPRLTVFVSQDKLPKSGIVESDCSPNAQGTVGIVAYRLNNIALDVDFPCDGYLATSEVMYPGWEAFVDNKKVYIFEGNLTFRTLIVPKGKHTIVMRYNPRIFLLSGLITLFTIFVSVWFIRRTDN